VPVVGLEVSGLLSKRKNEGSRGQLARSYVHQRDERWVAGSKIRSPCAEGTQRLGSVKWDGEDAEAPLLADGRKQGRQKSPTASVRGGVETNSNRL